MTFRHAVEGFLCASLLATACGEPSFSPIVEEQLTCGSDCLVPEARCPPPAPQSFEVGEPIADLPLLACDETPFSPHRLCGARVGLVASFYGWCPSCFDYVRMVEDLDQTYGARGLVSLVVVVEDMFADPATAAYCSQITDYFDRQGLTAFDPQASLEAYGTTDLVILTDRDGVIILSRKGPTVETLQTAIEEQLARYE